jgi:type I restriction enzyme S subunit
MSKNINVPKLRFKEFSGDWEERKLGNLGDFQGGGTPSTTDESYWVGNIPWVSSSDIIEGDIKNIKISKFVNTKAIKESATKLIPQNSLLFVSRVGVGKLAIACTDLCTSQDFTNLTLKNESSYFIGSYFLSKTNLLEKYSQGTSIKGFTTGDLKTLKLVLPTKPEQEKIAAFLTSVDTRIEQITKKESLLKQYKKGVMQKIFSQEIRFKADDGTDFPAWQEKRLGEVTNKKSSNISANQLDENNGCYKIYGATGYLKSIDFFTEKEPFISIVKDGAGVGIIANRPDRSCRHTAKKKRKVQSD